MDDEAKNIQ